MLAAACAMAAPIAPPSEVSARRLPTGRRRSCRFEPAEPGWRVAAASSGLTLTRASCYYPRPATARYLRKFRFRGDIDVAMPRGSCIFPGHRCSVRGKLRRMRPASETLVLSIFNHDSDARRRRAWSAPPWGRPLTRWLAAHPRTRHSARISPASCRVIQLGRRSDAAGVRARHPRHTYSPCCIAPAWRPHPAERAHRAQVEALGPGTSQIPMTSRPVWPMPLRRRR